MDVTTSPKEWLRCHIHASADRSELRQARMAVFGFFFVLGAATATWSARLPAIKAALHLSDGRLGLALFAVPAGAVLTLVASGRVADAFGAARVMRIAGLAVPAALVPIGLARGFVALIAALACYGAVAGLLDVSMNACGARLEAAYGRPILSSLHAGYSIAGLAGAGIGGIFAGLGIGPLPTFATAAALLAALAALVGPGAVIPPEPTPQPLSDRPGSPSRDAGPAGQPAACPSAPGLRSARQIIGLIWVLGLLALCGQLGEGSANDWSAVYLHVNLHAPAGVAAAGLAAFSVTMAAGRLAGDRLARRFGPVALVRASGLLAGLGLAVGMLVGTAAAAVAGFALLGAGLACIFPQIVSAAARLDPARAGRNIGRIAAVAYTGLLGGPVAIGALASGVGLRNALLLPAALALLVASLAGVMARHDDRPAGDAQPGRTAQQSRCLPADTHHLSSDRAARRLDAGRMADAARLAVRDGADGRGENVGGAVDVPGDRAGRVAHRRGHLCPAHPGQRGRHVLDLREEVAVPDVDERDRLVAVPGEERLLLRRRLLQVDVPERRGAVGGLAEPLHRDEGHVLAAVAGLRERQRGCVGVDVGG
jgi:MFS family permease